MITTTAEVICDDCGKVVDVEMIQMASSIPLFSVDNDCEGLENWDINDNTQHCEGCKN